MTRSVRLASLLRINQRVRWQLGDTVRVEAYLEQHPQLRGDPEALLDLIYQEIVLRRRRGETPQSAEYLERFGKLDGQLRLLFEVDQALDEVSSRVADWSLEGLVSTGQAAPAEVGQGLPTVPGYEILAELGRGGMGVVYQARHIPLQRPVALKMILAGPHASATERVRFRTEAEVVARLDHPNIIRIYEVGEHDGRSYLALEYAAGGSLRDRVAGVPQSQREAAELTEKLARAIAHAHQQGVLHRDLKPSNVLLAAEGVPKVTDFGLARRTDTGDGPTPTEAIIGSPNYMPPEQAAGRPEKIGVSADIYSLGAILYHLLTGRPPFQGTTLLDTLEQVRTQEPVRPTWLRGKLARDLETICLKCLAKRPDQRYKSAVDLADDLARFLDGQPIQARRVSQWDLLRQAARRRPALLAKGALAIAILCIGVSLLWDLWLAGQLARHGATEKYQAFVRHRDDAFFHGLLTSDQGGLFTGPEVAANCRAAESAAQKALAIAGVRFDQATAKPALEGADPAQLTADCYALLLILAEVREQPLIAGQPLRERYREALSILDRAGRLGLRTRTYHLRRHRYLQLLGEKEAAREHQLASSVSPDGPLDDFLLGNECSRRDDQAGAREAFGRALAAQPTHFWAQFFLAVCDLRRQQWEAARAGLTSCVAHRPEFIWAYLFRSFANEKLNALAEAEADFAKAQQLRPDENAHYVLLLTRGILRFKQMDLTRAMDDFRSARDLKPHQYNAYLNLAQVHLARNEFKQATRQMEQALQLRPPPLVVFAYHLERGRSLCGVGTPGEALGQFDKAIHLFPDHPAAHGLRGRVLLELGRYEESESAYDQYFRKGGESADSFRGRGLARMKLGRYLEAVDDYTRALERQPDGEIYQHRGWAHFFADAWKLALRDFQKAVELGPRVSDAYTGRGLAQVMLGRYREASADAESALRLEPQAPAMMHNIACIFAQAAARVSQCAAELDRQELANRYREQACQAVRRALEMLPPQERLSFWQDKILLDTALAPIRNEAGFKQVEKDFFPSGANRRPHLEPQKKASRMPTS